MIRRCVCGRRFEARLGKRKCPFCRYRPKSRQPTPQDFSPYHVPGDIGEAEVDRLFAQRLREIRAQRPYVLEFTWDYRQRYS